MPKPKNSDLMRLVDVPAMLLELTGTSRNRATIYNWATKGRHSHIGEKIKLKTTTRLGMMMTTREWVNEFIRKI